MKAEKSIVAHWHPDLASVLPNVQTLVMIMEGTNDEATKDLLRKCLEGVLGVFINKTSELPSDDVCKKAYDHFYFHDKFKAISYAQWRRIWCFINNKEYE